MNNLFNHWTILILGIWLCNAFACLISRKDKRPLDMSYAAITTILIGIGYLILKKAV